MHQYEVIVWSAYLPAEVLLFNYLNLTCSTFDVCIYRQSDQSNLLTNACMLNVTTAKRGNLGFLNLTFTRCQFMVPCFMLSPFTASYVQVHLDYLEAGANIIISASYQVYTVL